MQVLRHLLAILLISATSVVAKADDFQMVVIDPTVPSSLVNHIVTDNFTFIFPSSGPQSGCHASQLFGLSPTTYIGCFTGENDTGAALTSLRLLIPVFNFNGQQDQPGCSPVRQDIFATISCGFTADHSEYFLNFSGGSIPSTIGNADCDHDGDGGSALNNDDSACNAASIFTIAEAGIPPADFPPVQFSANAANAPEPSSLLLLSTGVVSGGFFLANWRRRTLSPTDSTSI